MAGDVFITGVILLTFLTLHCLLSTSLDMHVELVKNYALKHFNDSKVLKSALSVKNVAMSKKASLILNVDGHIAACPVDMPCCGGAFKVELVKNYALQYFSDPEVLKFALSVEDVITSKEACLISNVDDCMETCFVDALRCNGPFDNDCLLPTSLDMRVELAKNFALKHFSDSKVLKSALSVENAAMPKKASLILNVDGYIAACPVDMPMREELVKKYALLHFSDPKVLKFALSVENATPSKKANYALQYFSDPKVLNFALSVEDITISKEASLISNEDGCIDPGLVDALRGFGAFKYEEMTCLDMRVNGAFKYGETNRVERVKNYALLYFSDPRVLKFALSVEDVAISKEASLISNEDGCIDAGFVDPLRVELVKNFALKHFGDPKVLKSALSVENATTSKKVSLTLNVDGDIAAYFVDMPCCSGAPKSKTKPFWLNPDMRVEHVKNYALKHFSDPKVLKFALSVENFSDELNTHFVVEETCKDHQYLFDVEPTTVETHFFVEEETCKDHQNLFDVDPTSVEMYHVLPYGRQVVMVVVRGWQRRSCSSGSPVRQRGGDGGGERLAEAVKQQQQHQSHYSFSKDLAFLALGTFATENPGIAGYAH